MVCEYMLWMGVRWIGGPGSFLGQENTLYPFLQSDFVYIFSSSVGNQEQRISLLAVSQSQDSDSWRDILYQVLKHWPP